MVTPNMENDIIERIDAFIETCKEEIRKEQRKTADEKNRKAKQYQTEQQSELKEYAPLDKHPSKRFGFNSCVKDCFGEKSINAYKACRKRIADPKKKATQEDYKKMERLYSEMQKRYKNPDSFYECPPLPSGTTLLSKSLMKLMGKISKQLDKQIQNSSHKD